MTRLITATLLSDPYDFEIGIRTGKITSQTAELLYSGIPEPEVKYVSVYRVVYINDNERTDSQTFKIPQSGQDKMVYISELKPDVKYVVWLEAFLSNGRKKKSNVVEFSTKAGQLPTPEKSEIGELALRFLNIVCAQKKCLVKVSDKYWKDRKIIEFVMV